MMNNPVTIEIMRDDRSWDLIEVMPVWREEGAEFVTTGSYYLYAALPELEDDSEEAAVRRDTYLENIELRGEEHPGFLGSLHFHGIGYYEWKYEGGRLSANEVWRLVDCIQDFMAGKAHLTENGIITKAEHAPKDIALQFRYGKADKTYAIRLEEMEGHFVVLIDGEPAAQLELLEEDWEVTGGDIYDRDLLAEILRRIRANT